MNILTAFAGGRETLMLEKKGRFYTFADRSEAPGNSLEAILNWNKIEKLDIAEMKKPSRYGLPIKPEKAFLPAVNFRSHSTETSMPGLKEPYFFCKFSNAYLPHKGDVVYPRGVQRLDYEGEMGIIIGRKGKYIEERRAEEYVFGYTIVDDISLRDYQNAGQEPYGKDWVLGKNADTALPMGPWITPKDEFSGFPTTIETRVNGVVVQHGSTEDMIFSIPKLISRLSMVATLAPGDIITTGTPSGVAEYTTKKYLKPGDEVEVSIEGIGTLKHGIVEDPAGTGA